MVRVKDGQADHIDFRGGRRQYDVTAISFETLFSTITTVATLVLDSHVDKDSVIYPGILASTVRRP